MCILISQTLYDTSTVLRTIQQGLQPCLGCKGKKKEFHLVILWKRKQKENIMRELTHVRSLKSQERQDIYSQVCSDGTSFQ